MWSQSVCYWLLLTWLSCSRSTWSWKHQVWFWSVISVTCFAKAVDNLGNLFGWNINKHCFTETYGIIVLYHYAVERALGVLSILRRCHSSCKLQLSSLGSLSNDNDKALKKNAIIFLMTELNHVFCQQFSNHHRLRLIKTCVESKSLSGAYRVLIWVCNWQLMKRQRLEPLGMFGGMPQGMF